MINAKLSIKLDTDGIGKRHEQALQKAQLVLDEQVLKDSNRFIPKDTGNLERSSSLHSRLGEGHIEWNTPYAARLYYNPQYNFSKDENPLAQGLWYEAAKAQRNSVWVELTKRAYKRIFGG